MRWLKASQWYDEGLTGGIELLRKRIRKEREVYQRFLKDEDVSDDEGEVEEPISSDKDEKGSVGDEQEGKDEEKGSAEGLKLFTISSATHVATSSISSSSMNLNHQSGEIEIALAHLMHGVTGPSSGSLTRRRWDALLWNGDLLAQCPSYHQGELEGDEDDGVVYVNLWPCDSATAFVHSPPLRVFRVLHLFDC